MAPMYNYLCSCGQEVERMASVDDRDRVRIACPKCGKTMTRAMTTANFGKPRHQTKLILNSGEKISGTWEK